MRHIYLLLLPLMLFGGNSTVFSQSNPCDTIHVVASTTIDGSMDCITPYVVLTAAPHPSVLSVKWTGPGGFYSTQTTEYVSVPGTYTLTVTGPMGCTAVAQAIVTDLCQSNASTGLIPAECEDPTYIQPAETCQEACLVPLCLNDYFGSTNGFGESTVPNWCGTIENDQWFAFLSRGFSTTFTINNFNCENGNGIQAAIYDDCWTKIYCDGGFQGSAGVPTTISIPTLPMQAYYLVIDGYSGDICDFSITCNNCGDCPGAGGPGGNPGTPCPRPPVVGPGIVCPGGTYTYDYPKPSNCFVSGFLWTGPPGTLVNGEPVPYIGYYPNGRTVQVTFPNTTFSSPICVRELNYFTPPSLPRCKLVTSALKPITQLPTVTICPNSTYELPWGDVVTAPGSYTHTFLTPNGCDSTVRVTVLQYPPAPTIQQNRVICQGEQVVLFGQVFTQTGVYVEVGTSVLGCDSTVLLNLVVLEPNAEIISTGPVDCAALPLTLGSAPSPNSLKTWSLAATNTVIGIGDQVSVTEPGTYLLSVTTTLNGVQCTEKDTITIGGQNALAVQALGGVITCANPQVTLSANTSVTNASFEWTGPNGFVSMLQNPTVTVPGTYTVTMSAGLCTGTSTAQVNVNIVNPNITTVTSNVLSCNEPVANVCLFSGTAVVYQWLGPNQFTSTEACFTTSLPGDYTVTVSDIASGCTSVATVTVNQIPPLTAQAVGDTITCDHPTAQLNVFTSAPASTYQWTGPNGFFSDLPNPTTDSAGIYIVTVSDAEGCEATAFAIVTGGCTVSAGETPDLAMVRVYPVPSTGIVHVSLPEKWVNTEVQVRIYDTLGRLALVPDSKTENKELVLNIHGLPSGAYLVQCQLPQFGKILSVLVLKI